MSEESSSTVIRVLIADDQHLFAEGLRYVLEGEGKGEIAVLGVARNGLEAVEMARDLLPDVILMDVRMPEMDGVEATDRIHREMPSINVMILTTFDDDELACRALQCGANGFVLKNVEPYDLVQALRAVSRGVLYVAPSVGFRLVKQIASGESSRPEVDTSIVQHLAAAIPVLTMREAEVLALVARARRNTDIAELLFISEKTVKNHISNIYDKLGIHNRLQLISYVSRVCVS